MDDRLAQFAMYRVTPEAGWAGITPNPGITARDIANLTTEMREILFSAMQDAVVDVNRTSKLRSRRGAIYRSIMSGLRPRGSRYPGTVSVTFMMRPWVAIHETGGTIRPRVSRYLALPMPFALRADGRLKRRSPDGWRDYNTFVYTARSGNKFIVFKRDDQLVFLYHLVDRVTLKKRIYLKEMILRQENVVVAAWSESMMRIFNGLDLYGVAFEGVRIT